MMKKLLLLGVALVSMVAASKAQNTYTAEVTDTLHYYFNKFYFKTGELDKKKYPYYKSAANTIATQTNVTHCGSRFENAATLTVTGVEAFAAKPLFAANVMIPITMYLCSLDVNGLPKLPAIDSVATNVAGGAVNTPSIVGGNFKYLLGNQMRDTSHVLTGDFAVLIRNMSTVAGDTVLILCTAGRTETNIPATSAEKYSDGGYGFTRFGMNFYKTTDFTLASGFGVGTDIEFMVSPRVKYEVQASHEIPQAIIDFNDQLADTLCTRMPHTFKNTSSYQFTNRFYNLNEFYRKWNLYSAFVAQPLSGGFSADSSITWNFEYKEQSDPLGDGRVFLPYINNSTIVSITDRPGCFQNTFRARLRLMGQFGSRPQIAFNIPFGWCMRYCNDAAGIGDNGNMPNLKVSPNPLAGGKSKITGLEGNNHIYVYDALGQLIISKPSSESTFEVDLQNQAKGTYIVRVVNSQEQVKVIKLINQD